MKAMILAAGLGTRMKKIGEETPKALLLINNRPLIVYHLENLANAGYKEIVINVCAHADKIKKTLKDGREFGVHVHYSTETEPLGTGGGIAKALPLLGDQHFLVISTDIWTDYPLNQLPAYLPSSAHLVLVDNPPDHTQGDFGLEDGIVISSGENKSTYGGIGLFHPKLFNKPRSNIFSIIDVLNPVIAKRQVTGEHYQGKWININTPEILKQIES